MEMAEQFNKQQLLLSKSISDHISAYLFFFKQDAIHAANMIGRLSNIDKKIVTDISREFIKKKEIIKTNFGVIDKKGNLLFYDGNMGEDAHLFNDILNKVEEVESSNAKIIETSKTIIILSPISHSSKNLGAVFFAINIEDIANHFVGNIKSGNRGYAWIINKKGTLLYHPTQPGMMGGNIFKTEKRCFNCHINFDLEKRIIEGKTSNYGRHIAPSGEDKIIAFSDLNIDELSWIIAVSAPYSEVTLATKRSMNIYSYLIISLFVAASAISGILIMLNKKRIKAEEAAKRKEEIERYAMELEERVKERTAELLSEKEKLDTIVSAIGGGIIIIDKNARIIWANEVIKNMFNKNVVGKYCEELWEDCDISSSHVKDDIETIILSSFWGQKDKFFQITTAPIKGKDGEIHGYIRLIQDVTEIKKMEEQIIHSEKLASIGRLAAGIAHEIGNPLTSIFSFVQILREIEDEPFKKESLDTIYFHINRISEILKQLSGFSKMPTGEIKECNINEIVETTINLIQYDKRAKNINIVKELSPSLPLITIDGNRLSQVFVNLTLNAIDAMPDGGTLTIKTFQDKNDIVIVFQDTGVGIPKADISKIFDPFFTTKEKGTGLGLAVSYDIIKKMNGSLTVDSEIGKGTTFIIKLPSTRIAQ
jgi:signal transduction histidine kinase